jgi:hypothetical protein
VIRQSPQSREGKGKEKELVEALDFALALALVRRVMAKPTRVMPPSSTILTTRYVAFV